MKVGIRSMNENIFYIIIIPFIYAYFIIIIIVFVVVKVVSLIVQYCILCIVASDSEVAIYINITLCT